MSAALVAEAETASIAFQQALLRLGATTIVEVLAAWRRVNPAKIEATAGAWLEDAIHMISTRRGQSRELAIGYYRLVRALRTGTTVPDPRKPEPTYVTMAELRKEFAGLIADSKVEVSDDFELGEDEAVVESGGGEDRVEIDQDDDLDRLIREMEAQERAEIEAARKALEALGPDNLDGKLKVIDSGKLTGAELDAKRDEAHAQAGARAAAAAERAVLDAARRELYARSQRDKKAIGFIRLSRSGTPCGWCAMLISRGPVYTSRATAAARADGDLYHDNCHCYAEPVFSRDDYSGSALYELNRRYGKEWPKVTKGLSGRAALNAWRRYLRRQQRTTAPQAGAPTPIAQEA